MDWEDLENHVRDLAAFHWLSPARAETINGVSFDCVVKIKPDYWILIEVTKDDNLSKLRTDIAKIASVRPYLFSQQIYAECYFVCINPSQQMRITGEGNGIKVLSVDELRDLLIGYEKYYHHRSSLPFGSAKDWRSGERDKMAYIKVEYLSLDKKNLTLFQIYVIC